MKKSLLAICLVLLLTCALVANSKAQIPNLRIWPVPPIPAKWIPKVDTVQELPVAFQQSMPKDAQTVANDLWEHWQNYAIYVIIVLVIPIVVGLLLWICTFVVCCCGCCWKGKLFKTGQSPKQVTLKGGIPYLIVWICIALITIASLFFFIQFVIGIDNVRKEVFPVANTLLKSPDVATAALDNIPGVMPNISSLLVAFIGKVSDFKPLMNQVLNITAGIKDDITNIKPFLDNNTIYLQNIVNTQNAMVDKSSSANTSMTKMDFAPFQSVFANSTSLLTGNITSQISSVLDSVQQSLSSIETTIQGIQNTTEQQLVNIANLINGTIAPIKAQIEVVKSTVYTNEYFLQVMGNQKEDGTFEKMSEYESYTFYGEIGIAVGVSLLLSISAIIATFGFLCVCIAPKADPEGEKQDRARSCNICCQVSLCLFDCYTSTALLLFAIISGGFLLFWFVSGDACREGSTYAQRSEAAVALPSITLPDSISAQVPNFTFPNISITGAISGVLSCPEDYDIMKASGISFKTFGVENTVQAMIQKMTSGMLNFDLGALTSQALSQVSNMNSSVTLPSADSFTSSLNSMSAQLENGVVTFFRAFPLLLELSDFETLDQQWAQANGILSKYGITNITKTNVLDFSPAFYDVEGFRAGSTTPVPGRLTAVGNSDAKFNSTIDNVPASELNLLYGSRAFVIGTEGQRILVAPKTADSTVELGLIFNLSRMLAQDPFNSQFQYESLLAIRSNISAMNTNINQMSSYISGILSMKGRFDPLIAFIEDKFNSVIAELGTLIGKLLGVLETAIANEPALKCGWFGRFYNTTTQSYCSNILVSVGGTSITILCAMFVFFFATIVIYWSCILHEKLNYGSIDEDDWSEQSQELVEIK